MNDTHKDSGKGGTGQHRPHHGLENEARARAERLDRDQDDPRIRNKPSSEGGGTRQDRPELVDEARERGGILAAFQPASGSSGAKSSARSASSKRALRLLPPSRMASARSALRCCRRWIFSSTVPAQISR